KMIECKISKHFFSSQKDFFLFCYFFFIYGLLRYKPRTIFFFYGHLDAFFTAPSVGINPQHNGLKP
ncbi:MAG: hypothetical protein O7D30_12170, partial [Rickettsia endosymbiont of Ixodes persulcatus]|nr:hypothetical protein [Rickettsia endosymbiont of Ixodes persulcatus]